MRTALLRLVSSVLLATFALTSFIPSGLAMRAQSVREATGLEELTQALDGQKGQALSYNVGLEEGKPVEINDETDLGQLLRRGGILTKPGVGEKQYQIEGIFPDGEHFLVVTPPLTPEQRSRSSGHSTNMMTLAASDLIGWSYMPSAGFSGLEEVTIGPETDLRSLIRVYGILTSPKGQEYEIVRIDWEKGEIRAGGVDRHPADDAADEDEYPDARIFSTQELIGWKHRAQPFDQKAGLEEGKPVTPRTVLQKDGILIYPTRQIPGRYRIERIEQRPSGRQRVVYLQRVDGGVGPPTERFSILRSHIDSQAHYITPAAAKAASRASPTGLEEGLQSLGIVGVGTNPDLPRILKRIAQSNRSGLKVYAMSSLDSSVRNSFFDIALKEPGLAVIIAGNVSSLDADPSLASLVKNLELRGIPVRYVSEPDEPLLEEALSEIEDLYAANLDPAVPFTGLEEVRSKIDALDHWLKEYERIRMVWDYRNALSGVAGIPDVRPIREMLRGMFARQLLGDEMHDFTQVERELDMALTQLRNIVTSPVYYPPAARQALHLLRLHLGMAFALAHTYVHPEADSETRPAAPDSGLAGLEETKKHHWTVIPIAEGLNTPFRPLILKNGKEVVVVDSTEIKVGQRFEHLTFVDLQTGFKRYVKGLDQPLAPMELKSPLHRGKILFKDRRGWFLVDPGSLDPRVIPVEIPDLGALTPRLELRDGTILAEDGTGVAVVDLVEFKRSEKIDLSTPEIDGSYAVHLETNAVELPDGQILVGRRRMPNDPDLVSVDLKTRQVKPISGLNNPQALIPLHRNGTLVAKRGSVRRFSPPEQWSDPIGEFDIYAEPPLALLDDRVVISERNALVRANLASGEIIRVNGLKSPRSAVERSGDGRIVVADDSGLAVVNFQTKEVESRIPLPFQAFWVDALPAQGSRFLVSGGGTIAIASTPTGLDDQKGQAPLTKTGLEENPSTERLIQALASGKFSPNGNALLRVRQELMKRFMRPHASPRERGRTLQALTEEIQKKQDPDPLEPSRILSREVVSGFLRWLSNNPDVSNRIQITLEEIQKAEGTQGETLLGIKEPLARMVSLIDRSQNDRWRAVGNQLRRVLESTPLKEPARHLVRSPAGLEEPTALLDARPVLEPPLTIVDFFGEPGLLRQEAQGQPPKAITFFLDAGDPQVLRLGELMALTRLRDSTLNLKIDFIGVARKSELEALLRRLPHNEEGDFIRIALDNRIVTYEQDHEYPDAVGQAWRLSGFDRNATRVIQDLNQGADLWLEAIQTAGLTFWTDDLKERVLKFLRSA